MLKSEPESSDGQTPIVTGKMLVGYKEKLSNLNYLRELMSENKTLIKEVIDVFLTQIPKEVRALNEAVHKADYAIIKQYAHTMRSTVSVMGISVLTPILREMEDLGETYGDLDRINILNLKLNVFCNQAIDEIKEERQLYV